MTELKSSPLLHYSLSSRCAVEPDIKQTDLWIVSKQIKQLNITQMNRREVVQKFLLGGTVLVLAPSVLESCSKTAMTNPGTGPAGTSTGTTIDLDLSLAQYSALNSTGSSKIVQNILIINTGTKIVALSSICTHQGCTVGYNAGAAEIDCPCHGSVFSTNGSVLVGPASSPLRSYPVSVTGNVLTITL